MPNNIHDSDQLWCKVKTAEYSIVAYLRNRDTVSIKRQRERFLWRFYATRVRLFMENNGHWKFQNPYANARKQPDLMRQLNNKWHPSVVIQRIPHSYQPASWKGIYLHPSVAASVNSMMLVSCTTPPMGGYCSHVVGGCNHKAADKQPHVSHDFSSVYPPASDIDIFVI